MKNLTAVTSSELQSILDSFDNVLCDCDGVLWAGNTYISQTKEAIEKLRECGKKIIFVTNNSALGFDTIFKTLNKYGFNVDKNDIVTPTLAIIAYLQSIEFNKKILFLSSSYMKQDFTKAGFNLADFKVETIQEGYESLLNALQDDIEVGAVIFDVDLNLNYAKFLKAQACLKRPEVLFIIAASDKKILMASNTVIPGPGSFQRILEDITGRTGIQFGKPELNLNKYIIKKYKIDNPARTLLIGDSLDQDMEFARKCGYQKLLVLSGVTSLLQLQAVTSAYKTPNFYLESLGLLPKILKDKLDI